MSGQIICPLALPLAWITGLRTTWSEAMNTPTRARTVLRLRCTLTFLAKGRRPEPMAADKGAAWTNLTPRTNNNQLFSKGFLSLSVVSFLLSCTFHTLYTDADWAHNPGGSDE